MFPFITVTPSTVGCQGPASPQTGRLASDCVSNRSALTDSGSRRILPKGNMTLYSVSLTNCHVFLTKAIADCISASEMLF